MLRVQRFTGRGFVVNKHSIHRHDISWITTLNDSFAHTLAHSSRAGMKNHHHQYYQKALFIRAYYRYYFHFHFHGSLMCTQNSIYWLSIYDSVVARFYAPVMKVEMYIYTLLMDPTIFLFLSLSPSFIVV